MSETMENNPDRTKRLSEKQRRNLLKSFDELVPAIQERSLAEVEAEIAEIRRARRSGGPRNLAEPSGPTRRDSLLG